MMMMMMMIMMHDDCTLQVAFSEDESWGQVGNDADYAKTYDFFSSKEFSVVIVYINQHYQVVIKKTSCQENHDDFFNFVGSHPFIYYYHC